MVDYRQWQSCEHDDEPRDQQRDFDDVWAQIGPDERQQTSGWSWTVMESGDPYENPEIGYGFAPDEASAKLAVEQFVKSLTPAPSWWDRLRSFFLTRR